MQAINIEDIIEISVIELFASVQENYWSIMTGYAEITYQVSTNTITLTYPEECSTYAGAFCKLTRQGSIYRPTELEEITIAVVCGDWEVEYEACI